MTKAEGPSPVPGLAPIDGAPAAPSCFLIGATGMAARCGELLQERGFNLLGVLTDDPLLRRWALKRDLPCWAADAVNLNERLGAQRFDLLFSVINARVLRPALLTQARIAAINYHDGPLPAYAGVNATAWAILNGESEYGVSWALMSTELDAGDLVKQTRFPLRPDETTGSLNLRCTEAALVLFEALLDDLLAGRMRPVAQAREGGSYYRAADRPYAGGLVRWDQPAESIRRLVRALDFGRVDNPLCLPKLMLGAQPYTFSTAQPSPAPNASEHAVGTAVIDAQGSALLVRCQDIWLRIGGLRALAGEPGTAADAWASVERYFAAAPGATLAIGEYPFELDQLDALCHASARNEPRWIDWMRRAAPLDLSLAPQAAMPSDAAPRRIETEPDGLHPFVLMVLFLARLTEDGSVPLTLRSTAVDTPALRPLFLSQVPFRAEVSLTAPLTHAIAQAQDALEQALTFVPPLSDLPLRYTGLEAAPAEALIVSPDAEGLSWELAPAGTDAAVTEALLWLRAQVFADNLRRARADATAHQAPCLADLALVSEAERSQLLARLAADTRPFDLARTYIQHFVARLPMHADRIAVRFQGASLTYAELARQAAAVADRLERLGLASNSTIAVVAERHLSLVPALLGVFAAGHAYLPLEPERYPPERLAAMLVDADVRTAVVLTEHGARAIAGQTRLQVLNLSDARSAESMPTPAGDEAFGLTPYLARQTPDATAYLIFTSGSTGVPKGVMVAQRSLVNHNLAVIEDFALTQHDHVLQLGALGFDLSIEEIFPTLLVGARLVLLPDGVKESAPDFFGLLREEAISFLDLPTAFWHAMVAMLESEVLPPSVRLVVIGGEKASVEHAERWRRKVPGVRLVNTYGPTETTIIATASEDLATIGQPIANAYAYVLDGYRKLCPPGVIGELHIGGEPVAKGYLNREDLTAKAFLPDPFAAEIAVQVRQLGREPVSATAPTAGSARMYRTGDKVGLASDGQLWFFGRADGQVKISGFRIETDEIRQAVLGEQGVRDAAVVAIERPGAAESGRLELACYLVVTDPELDANRLRERIGQHLPEYMIPRHWVFVDAIPLNANGKVDRAALPPVPAEAAGAASCLDPEVNSTLELQIAAALRSALGIEHYDRNASFDALGGDSLSAIQFLLELEKLTGQPVSVEVLYQAQSMAALADAIEQLDDKPWSPFVQLRSGESGKPPLFLVHTTPGDVLGYINLVKYLDDRAVIGIQARGLDLSAEPATSIETMARDYVALVRDYLPAGPYYLSGWCYGGIVAHEMVAQLEQQGVEPGLFVAIETWGEPAPTLASTLRKLWNLITWGPRGWRGFAAAKWRRLLGGATVEDQDLDELDFIGRRFGSSRSTAELERMKALYTINTEAADRYRMPRIRAHVDLLMIKADANPGRVPDPTYWWRGIAPHRRIQTFDGDHATVLKEPAVRRIGQALVELMQLADRRVGAVAD